MFLRKQSRNSLANWWSVCFKMFFPNVVICGMASTGSATVYENYFYAQPPCMKIIFMLSHRVWKLFLCSATVYENYFYALLFYFLNAKFLLLNCFFKYAKLAKFIRSEARWKLYIFYHKVHGDVVKRWCFWGLWGTLELKVWRLCAAMFF